MQSPEAITEEGTIAVTGATGFVGGQLLVRLLGQTDSKIVCLIRADSVLGAEERGRKCLSELLGDRATAVQHRVRWVRADLEQFHLGCSRATWATLAREVTEIYHCAASVSFDLPLDEAHRINVAGTRHIFDLACDAHTAQGSFRRFHHVSTAYVAGVTRGRVSPGFLPSDRAGNFRNTYERTKARAERLLAGQGKRRGIPVSIYRPSIVAGRTTDGATDNWNVLYVPMRMGVRGQLPVFRQAGRQLVDSVGVDFVVDGMIELGRLDSAAGAIFATHHLTAGASAFTVADLMSVTYERSVAHDGYKPSNVKMLGAAQWRALTIAVQAAARAPKRVGRIRRTARLAARSLDKCQVYIPYTGVNTVFDASRDHELLRWADITMPAGLTYLQTIVGYALATDFGKNLQSAAPIKASSSSSAAEDFAPVAVAA